MNMQLENKKKKELKLEPIKHLLLNPITDNGNEITELTFEPLTFSVYSAVDVEQDNDLVVEEYYKQHQAKLPLSLEPQLDGEDQHD